MMKAASGNLAGAAAQAQWSTIGLVVGIGVLAAMQIGKVAIATPSLQSELGLDLAAAGWLNGVFAVLGLAGGIPAGALVAHAGDRRVLLAGLASMLLGGVIGALAPGYAILLGARLLEGFGFLLIGVAGPALVSRTAGPAQRGPALALWSCFMPAGIALAMAGGAAFGDWRLLWWANAALAALLLLAGWRRLPRAAADRGTWRPPGPDAVRVLSNRGPLLLALCFALYSLMFFALFSFLPVLLMGQMGLSHAEAGLLGALASLANIAGNLAAARLPAQGAGRARVLAGASLVMGLAGLGIFLQALGPTATFLLCALFAGVGGLVPATLLAAAPDMVRPALVPVALGLLIQGNGLGQTMGPIAVGSAVQAHGWPAAAAIVLAAALAAAMAGLALRHHPSGDTG